MIALVIIKRNNGRHQWLQKHGAKQVLIWSKQWYSWWRSERCGYTLQKAEAGIYTLADAYDATSHCGPEKEIFYQFVR